MMQIWKVTQLIVLELLGGDQYRYHYPTVFLPNVCAICGQKADTHVPLKARGRIVTNTTYTIARRVDKLAFASMQFQIPLCNSHDKEIKDYSVRQNQYAKESIILLAVSILASSAIIFLTKSPSNIPLAGKILFSLFLGALGGLCFVWPVIGILLPFLVRLALHKNYVNPFGHKDHGLPTVTISEIFNNDAVLKLVFSFRNQQYYQEFLRQSNVKQQLLAAMYHPNYSVSSAALDALVENGINDAAPAILKKFIEDVGKPDGTCWGTARALEKMGIPQPVDKNMVDQLVAGMKFSNTRDLAAAVVLLCGIDNVIPHLQNPDPEIRIALLKAIGKKRMKDAVSAIIPILSDPDKSKSSVSVEAAKTLKRIGTPEALAAVEKWEKSYSSK